MTRVQASWGHGESAGIDSAEHLDVLLDRIEREARASGRPQDVQLEHAAGAGTLGIVVGDDRSLLNFIPADNNPPYLTSVGDEDEDRTFTFYVAGDHHSESHWRHTIPVAAAREAARNFVLTGRLDDHVEWDEV